MIDYVKISLDEYNRIKNDSDAFKLLHQGLQDDMTVYYGYMPINFLSSGYRVGDVVIFTKDQVVKDLINKVEALEAKIFDLETPKRKKWYKF